MHKLHWGSELGQQDVDDIVKLAIDTDVFTPDEIDCLREDSTECLGLAQTDGEKRDALAVLRDPDGVLLGFVQIGKLPITENSWCLWWIAVAKGAQGRGIGTLLLDWSFKKAEFLSCSLGSAREFRMFIETSSKDAFAPARGLYTRSSFVETARIFNYYSTGDAKVIFVRDSGR